MKEYYEVNKSLWNQKTPVHAQSEFYDLPAFKAGKSSLNPIELELLGDVTGKSMLHLQCHFGLDSLSWARLGAKVTGLDFSDEAIRLARSLSEELKIEATFVESNVYDIESQLSEPFDIVFASYGTICWLPDLQEWARLVAKYLKPGGTFCFVEFHPVLYMLDWDTLQLGYSYFNTGTPYMDEMEGTYADPSADLVHKEYFWNHSLSETLQSLLDQGLELQHIGEYPYNYYNFLPGTTQRPDGTWSYPDKGDELPMMFSLKMKKK